MLYHPLAIRDYCPLITGGASTFSTVIQPRLMLLLLILKAIFLRAPATIKQLSCGTCKQVNSSILFSAIPPGLMLWRSAPTGELWLAAVLTEKSLSGSWIKRR